MNFHTVICPTCGNSLTVSQRAPVKLTCPRCLASVENPKGGNAGAEPIPVLPLEDQTARDTKTSRGLTLLLTLVIASGVLVMLDRLRSARVIVLLLAAGFAAYVLILSVLRRRARNEFNEGIVAENSPPAAAFPPGTLHYQSRNAARRDSRDSFNILAAMGGFLLAIGVCAGGVFLLGSTFGSHLGYVFIALVVFAIVILCFVSAAFGDRRGLIGFGPGVIIGLVLGMMVLGPCGLCYLAAIK